MPISFSHRFVGEPTAVSPNLTWTPYSHGPPHYQALSNWPLNHDRYMGSPGGGADDNYVVQDPWVSMYQVTRVRMRVWIAMATKFGATAQWLRVRLYTGTDEVATNVTQIQDTMIPVQYMMGGFHDVSLSWAQLLDMNFRMLDETNGFGDHYMRVSEVLIDYDYVLPAEDTLVHRGRSPVRDPQGAAPILDPTGRAAVRDPAGSSPILDPSGRSPVPED